MAKPIQVVVNTDGDEAVMQEIAAVLRENSKYSRQIRDFASAAAESQRPNGLKFQPQPGQILICHFGLGFQVPENVKTRPVIVISPNQRDNTGLVIVAPISSGAPRRVRPYHYKLPEGIVPSKKYEESWIKGDLIVSVGLHRLDRFKVGFRDYRAPIAPDHVLREVRRCALHACGMHNLTEHL